jgi:hypothetical protein
VNGKPAWVGIAPTPQVFRQLDPEETTVLAFLAWSTASRRRVTANEVAALPDRDDKPLGIGEAKAIVRSLAELKIASVLGMNNDRPLSVFLGGFQAPSGPRPAFPPTRTEPKAEPKLLIENRTSGLPELKTTSSTPAYVPTEAAKLRTAQAAVEGGEFGEDLVAAAEERKRILVERIGLYERWRAAEPGHSILPKFLERKRKALPELEFQIERARVKQAERDAEAAAS